MGCPGWLHPVSAKTANSSFLTSEQNIAKLVHRLNFSWEMKRVAKGLRGFKGWELTRHAFRIRGKEIQSQADSSNHVGGTNPLVSPNPHLGTAKDVKGERKPTGEGVQREAVSLQRLLSCSETCWDKELTRGVSWSFLCRDCESSIHFDSQFANPYFHYETLVELHLTPLSFKCCY